MRSSNIDKPIYDGKTTKELLADRETYEQLLDDYIDGIDVKEDEDVSDYLKRKGFKGILDEATIKNKISKFLMAFRISLHSPHDTRVIIIQIKANFMVFEARVFTVL